MYVCMYVCVCVRRAEGGRVNVRAAALRPRRTGLALLYICMYAPSFFFKLLVHWFFFFENNLVRYMCTLFSFGLARSLSARVFDFCEWVRIYMRVCAC